MAQLPPGRSMDKNNWPGRFYAHGDCEKCGKELFPPVFECCERCGVAVWCSEGCQAADAAEHAAVCSEWNSEGKGSRGTASVQCRREYRKGGRVVAVGYAAVMISGKGSVKARAKISPVGPGDDLCRAAHTGDVGALARLLDDGAAVDGRDGWGATPLARAAARGRADAVRLLLDRGASVDEGARGSPACPRIGALAAATAAGRTALCGAAEGGGAGPRVACLRLLLQRGADPNVPGAEPPLANLAATLARLREGGAAAAAVAPFEAAIEALCGAACELERDDPVLAPLLDVAPYSVAATAALLRAGANPNAAVMGPELDGRSGLDHPVRDRVRAMSWVVGDGERGAAVPPDFDGWSVKKLRAAIAAAGLSHADCVEKADLRRRCRDALEAAAPADQAERSIPHRTPLSRILRVAGAAGASAADNPAFALLLDHGADPRLLAPVPPLLTAVVLGDDRAAAMLVDAGADADAVLNLETCRVLVSGEHSEFEVKPEARKVLTIREFVAIHFGEGHAIRAAVDRGAAAVDLAALGDAAGSPAEAAALIDRACDAAVAKENWLPWDPDAQRLRLLSRHVRRASPAMLAWRDARLSRFASEPNEDLLIVEDAPQGLAPLPGTSARTLWIALHQWRCGLAAVALDESPARRLFIRNRADFDAAAADGRLAACLGPGASAAEAWPIVARGLERVRANSSAADDPYFELRMPQIGNPVQFFLNAILDASEVVADASDEELYQVVKATGDAMSEAIGYADELLSRGVQLPALPAGAMDVIVRYAPRVTFLAKWEEIGVDAVVAYVVAAWRTSVDFAKRWATMLVRTLMVSGAVQTDGDDRVRAWETAARAAASMRAALEPLPGFAEHQPAVVRMTFVRSLRLRAIEALERRGRDVAAPRRAALLDRAAALARDVVASCEISSLPDTGYVGFYGAEVGVAMLDTTVRVYTPLPQAFMTFTHFVLPYAHACFVLGLRARRDGDRGEAARCFVGALIHFPFDELKKVVAAWLLAEVQAGAGAPLGTVRAIAETARVFEGAFQDGAFGAPTADGDLPARAKVRALLRRAAALPDAAAAPGAARPDPAAVLDANAARFIKSLFGGAAATAPPRSRRRRRCCAFCGRMRLPGDPKFKTCSRCKAVVYCDAACQKAHWATHKKHCAKKPAEIAK